MSRKHRELAAVEDGVCPLSGLDVHKDADGDGKPFITREMLKAHGVRIDDLATNPRDALINVTMKISNFLQNSDPHLRDVDVSNFDKLISVLAISAECLSDKDASGLHAHLRSRGFLLRE